MISNLSKTELRNQIINSLNNEGINITDSYALNSFMESIVLQYGKGYDELNEYLDRVFNMKQDDNLAYQIQSTLGLETKFVQDTDALYVRLKTNNGESINTYLSYNAVSNGISQTYKNVEFMFNLNSFSYLDYLDEQTYNQLTNTDMLEVKQYVVYDNYVTLNKYDTFNVNGVYCEIKDNITLDLSYEPSIDKISSLVTSVVKAYIDDVYSYNTLILNQDNLKIIVESLMDRRFDNIVFVDKPRGDNSFDLVIVDNYIDVGQLNLVEQNERLSKILPIYIDQKIVEPIYFRLNITFNLDVVKFDKSQFIEYIETYFETNYKSFNKTQFEQYVYQYPNINVQNPDNSVSVELVVKNISGKEYQLGVIDEIQELDEYRYIAVNNLIINIL